MIEEKHRFIRSVTKSDLIVFMPKPSWVAVINTALRKSVNCQLTKLSAKNSYPLDIAINNYKIWSNDTTTIVCWYYTHNCQILSWLVMLLRSWLFEVWYHKKRRCTLTLVIFISSNPITPSKFLHTILQRGICDIKIKEDYGYWQFITRFLFWFGW